MSPSRHRVSVLLPDPLGPSTSTRLPRPERERQVDERRFFPRA